MAATKLVGGLVGRVNHTVHPGGRCAVCGRRFRDLDRHWTVAHEWFSAPAQTATAETATSSLSL